MELPEKIDPDVNVILVRQFATPTEVALLAGWAMRMRSSFRSFEDGCDTCSSCGFGYAHIADLSEQQPLSDELVQRMRDFLGGKGDWPVTSGRVAPPGFVINLDGSNVNQRPIPLLEPFLRLSILISKPTSGGDLTIDGIPVALEEGDLWCLKRGVHNVQVSAIVGPKIRLLYTVGFDETKDEFPALAARKGL